MSQAGTYQEGQRLGFADHYSVLDVSPDATEQEIKRSFRALVRVHHPDQSRDDGARFLEIYNAYRVLSDNDSRARYDAAYRLRQAAHRIGNFRVVGAERVRYGGDVVKLARGGLLSRRFRSRERRYYLQLDYDVELYLTPQEMHIPIRVALPVIVRTICPDCHGSDRDCFACDGTGYYKASRTIFVAFEGGLADGQFIDVHLNRLRAGSMNHFKRRRLRVRVSEVRLPVLQSR